MSTTRRRISEDIASQLQTRLEEASHLLRSRDALIRHLRRENKMLSDVRGELISELRHYRRLYPHVKGAEGCLERPYRQEDYSSE